MTPADLKKAPATAAAVLVSAKTWNALREVLISGWPLAGPGIAISQLATGRAIRTQVDAGASPPAGGAESPLPPPLPEGSGSGADNALSGDASGGDDPSGSGSEPSGSLSSSGSSGSDQSSPSSSSQPSESSSSKAIVLVGDLWIKWFCSERRTAEFGEVLDVPLSLSADGRISGTASIPPEMLACCEPGSITVASVISRHPAAWAAELIGGQVHLAGGAVGPWPRLEDLHATATVRGTRRGFGQQGWARSTEEEFVASRQAWDALQCGRLAL